MVSRTPVAALALLLMVAVGCDKEEPPLAPAPVEEAAALPDIPEGVETPPIEVAPSPRAPRREADPAIGPRVRRLVRDGRRLSRGGRHAAGLVKFKEALELNPGSARLRCETGYVAFHAEQLEEAERFVSEALTQLPAPARVSEHLRVPLAMCLFNAGLVFSARNHKDRARDAYEASVALRPNATVSRRLRALPPRTSAARPIGARARVAQAATSAEAATAAEAETVAEAETAPETEAEEAVELVAAEVAAAAPARAEVAPARALPVDASQASARLRQCRADCSGAAWDASPDCSAIEQEVVEPAGTARGLRAALIAGKAAFVGAEVSVDLVLSDAGGSLTDELLCLHSPGSFGLSASHEVRRFAYDQIIPGGANELVLTYTETENDEDLGVCERTGSIREYLVLCAAAPLRCARVLFREEQYFEYDGGCDIAHEGRRDDARFEERSGYALRVTLDNGRVVIARDASLSGSAPRGLIGRHPVERFMSSYPLSTAP